MTTIAATTPALRKAVNAQWLQAFAMPLRTCNHQSFRLFTNAQAMNKLPNPIDVYVGNRIRIRRKFLGLSQEALADHIGLTFQQVQKYEKGTNRVSASVLFKVSEALTTNVAYFFDGYEPQSSASEFSPTASEIDINRFLATTEGIELAQAFPKIRTGSHRRRILGLIQALASDKDGGE